jgi:hypothetical protein
MGQVLPVALSFILFPPSIQTGSEGMQVGGMKCQSAMLDFRHLKNIPAERLHVVLDVAEFPVPRRSDFAHIRQHDGYNNIEYKANASVTPIPAYPSRPLVLAPPAGRTGLSSKFLGEVGTR